MMKKIAGRRIWPSLFLSMFLFNAYASNGAAPTPAPAAGVTNLRAVLEDELRHYRKKKIEHVDWHSYWVVTWQAVPGAADYVVTYATSEGVSKKTKVLAHAPFRLEVALGDNPKSKGMLQREIQLQTIQSLLSVSVTPRMLDGSVGPASPWLRVGQVYPE